jgi:hypothetical protein
MNAALLLGYILFAIFVGDACYRLEEWLLRRKAAREQRARKIHEAATVVRVLEGEWRR